jgi:hypothetical protein
LTNVTTVLSGSYESEAWIWVDITETLVNGKNFTALNIFDEPLEVGYDSGVVVYNLTATPPNKRFVEFPFKSAYVDVDHLTIQYNSEVQLEVIDHSIGAAQLDTDTNAKLADIDNKWVAVDAANDVKGIAFLDDSYQSTLNAATGKTAATPKAPTAAAASNNTTIATTAAVRIIVENYLLGLGDISSSDRVLGKSGTTAGWATPPQGSSNAISPVSIISGGISSAALDLRNAVGTGSTGQISSEDYNATNTVDYRNSAGAGSTGTELNTSGDNSCGASSVGNLIIIAGLYPNTTANVNIRDSVGTGLTGRNLSAARYVTVNVSAGQY